MNLTELENAQRIVRSQLQPSPQLNWPLLSQRCGCEVWVKHENHNPTGAFKVRGGLVYIERLRQREPQVTGVVTATRGNHGQSVAFAAAKHGLTTVVVVPEGNNPEKNRAMEALGAELIIFGKDFDEAIPYAATLAQERGYHMMPSFHWDLVYGVASYSLEFLQAVPDLQRVYVPIGLGSGICGMISARNSLNLKTEIVGVCSTEADCYAQSLRAGHCVTTATANTIADGLAVRSPNPEALALMQKNVSDIVAVDEDEILQAIAFYFSDTHNLTEGAAAAPLAGLLKDRQKNPRDKVGVVLSGGNVDQATLVNALKTGK